MAEKIAATHKKKAMKHISSVKFSSVQLSSVQLSSIKFNSIQFNSNLEFFNFLIYVANSNLVFI
ncbi:MAG: hypothetical protein K9W44_00470 [Candidatus Lokiarchaeota archaeon]|nr:hypothetical protein [Candidatus Harpocratesius repetitus]